MIELADALEANTELELRLEQLEEEKRRQNNRDHELDAHIATILHLEAEVLQYTCSILYLRTHQTRRAHLNM